VAGGAAGFIYSIPRKIGLSFAREGGSPASSFETIQDLEKVVSERCVALASQREMIRASTHFHWWPKPCEGN